MRVLLLMSLVLLSPAMASAQVALNVNQTHTLNWHWDDAGAPVRSFLFQCGTERRDILDADARSLRFGSLVEHPGFYQGCTLSARNEAGLSAPVVIPDFVYAYSYSTLGLFLLELVGSIVALGSLFTFAMRRMARAGLRWSPPQQALPEPVIILTKERDYVHHDS